MTPEEQRIAIAESCGLKTGPLTRCWLPDYVNDLDAMHEAEKSISDRSMYLVLLAQITNCNPTFASAQQRAEAFLRTIGKWK